MKLQNAKYLLIAAALCLIGIVGLGYYYFMTDFSNSEQRQFVYVDDDEAASIWEHDIGIDTPHGTIRHRAR